MLNPIGTRPIETARLRLRRYRPSDAPALFEGWCTDPEVCRFYTWNPHESIAETEGLLSQWIAQYENPLYFHWVIEQKSTGRPIGAIYLDRIDARAQSAVVNYLLDRSAWGRGYATEATTAVVEFAFREVEFTRMNAHHHEANAASGRVLLKCGFTFVEERHVAYPDCRRIDGNYRFYTRGRDDAPRRVISVVPYDETWPAEFRRIRAEIAPHVADIALAIEHVGSTAVPGLCAKPIIDMNIVVEPEAIPEMIRRLEALGYTHEGDLGVAGREAFKYGSKPHLMRHHLYVCPRDSIEHRRQIAFRDHLRAHPEDRDAYGRIKRDMARRFPHDIDSYIQGKGSVVREMHQKLGLTTEMEENQMAKEMRLETERLLIRPNALTNEEYRRGRDADADGRLRHGGL